MKQSVVIVFFAVMLGLASCKSHKQTVVNRPQRVENSVSRPGRPKGAVTDSKNSVDKAVASKLVKEANKWLGTPYKYGGESRRGVDCSGMLMVIYRDVAGVKLPRNSAEQCNYCFTIDKRNLEPGDLVFFNTTKGKGKVSHVGMYIGSGKMIHSSSSRGVVISGLDEKYYVNHYHSSGRVYGITYAATGSKPKSKSSSVPDDGVMIASTSKKKKSVKRTSGSQATVVAPVEVSEMSLDDFVAMQQSKTDTAIVRAQAVAVESEAVAIADSVGGLSCQPVDSVSATPVDSVAAVERVAEPAVVPVKRPAAIVNGRRVEAVPVEQVRREPVDSVPTDSARQAEAIRQDVVKAMNFGK